MTERNLIVNADDFGASPAISAGIVTAHVDGVVTSTSLMVRGRAAREAVAMAREHPGLSLGLHWDLDSREAPPLDLGDAAAVRAELAAQVERFTELVGTGPTHVDSHHHVHRLPHIAPIARELAAPLGVPLREDGRVAFVGGFYGQWEWKQTDLHHVSPEFLIWILENEVAPGFTEIGCHPGRWTGDHVSVYGHEREAELATLTDPRIRRAIDDLGIRLVGYRELAR